MADSNDGVPPGPDGVGERREAVAGEVIRSPALYLGELVLPPPRRRRLRLSGRSLKNATFPVLHWLMRHAPRGLALLPVHTLTWLAGLLYSVRGNPLRQACEDLAAVARSRGIAHRPRDVYLRFLANVKAMFRAYLDLERRGVEAALERVELGDADAQRLSALLREHEGGIFAVPHNLASVFSAARLSRAFPVVIVSKNSSTARRTRMALGMFERLEARVLMVRGGSPVALSRAMFKVLRERNVLAATVENVSPDPAAVQTTVFGERVGFLPWAATIAARREVPVIPLWFGIRSDGRIEVRCGEGLVSADEERIVRHYMAFFEQRILHDPASWAYLADRKWRRVLRRAASAAATAAGDDPGRTNAEAV